VKSAFRKGMHELTLPTKRERWAFEKTLRQQLNERKKEIREEGKRAWTEKAALLKEAAKQNCPPTFEGWVAAQAASNPESAEIRAATAHLERLSKFKAGVQQITMPPHNPEHCRPALTAPIGRPVVASPAARQGPPTAGPTPAALDPLPRVSFVFNVQSAHQRIKAEEAVEEAARKLATEQAEAAGEPKIVPEQSTSKIQDKSPAAAATNRETKVSTHGRSRDSRER
jgi:hypothetical protein